MQGWHGWSMVFRTWAPSIVIFGFCWITSYFKSVYRDHESKSHSRKGGEWKAKYSPALHLPWRCFSWEVICNHRHLTVMPDLVQARQHRGSWEGCFFSWVYAHSFTRKQKWMLGRPVVVSGKDRLASGSLGELTQTVLTQPVQGTASFKNSRDFFQVNSLNTLLF